MAHVLTLSPPSYLAWACLLASTLPLWALLPCLLGILSPGPSCLKRFSAPTCPTSGPRDLFLQSVPTHFLGFSFQSDLQELGTLALESVK